MNAPEKPLMVLCARTRKRTRSGKSWLETVNVIVAEITADHLAYATSEVLRLTLTRHNVYVEDIEIVVRFSP